MKMYKITNKQTRTHPTMLSHMHTHTKTRIIITIDNTKKY